MHFLVDAQLPPALARWLVGRGHVAEHVADLAMATRSDREIWQRAVALGAVIVTKDQDFASRRATEMDGPPIVWLRCGNTRRHELLTWFDQQFSSVVAALERGEILIEIA
jgi:predicted nuclease of predicted toxin-antitoxin system